MSKPGWLAPRREAKACSLLDKADVLRIANKERSKTAILMRYVIIIVGCTVYMLWDGMYHDGAYTRGVFDEVARVASRIF